MYNNADCIVHGDQHCLGAIKVCAKRARRLYRQNTNTHTKLLQLLLPPDARPAACSASGLASVESLPCHNLAQDHALHKLTANVAFDGLQPAVGRMMSCCIMISWRR